jgi:hypothetical protein
MATKTKTKRKTKKAVREKFPEALDCPVKYGQITCEHKGCSNGAYFLLTFGDRGDLHLCGVHRKSKANRGEEEECEWSIHCLVDGKVFALQKRSATQIAAERKEKIAQHELTVRALQLERKKEGHDRGVGFLFFIHYHHTGAVVCAQMRMRKWIGFQPGWLNVYPNHRDGSNQWEGVICPELSPMKLVPDPHCQPGLPQAHSIESLHQCVQKCCDECDEAVPAPAGGVPLLGIDGKVVRQMDRMPGPKFYATRLIEFANTVPRRHKHPECAAAKKKRGENANVTLCSVWRDVKTGQEVFLDYLASRQIYCYFYAAAVKKQPAFQKLRELVASGVCLRICGYDGLPIPANQTLMDAYRDASTPFGHERVLQTMLVEQDESKWPWNICRFLQLVPDGDDVEMMS